MGKQEDGDKKIEMKAHQAIIRKQKAETDKHNLFGNWWGDIDKNLKNAVVREINYNTARNVVEEYEWLGCMPAICLYHYGIFFDNNCGGVVVYSKEYSENLGVWNKYGFTGKMLLLSRGACVHWTPINTASKLIMESIKMLPLKYTVITAIVDELAGEIGTIYQACNFHYVGSMREQNPKCKNMTRFGIKVDGKIIGSRSIRAKIGNQRIEEVRKIYPKAEIVTQMSKARYFLFRGSKKNKKQHFNAIKHLIKSYPKRNEKQI